MGVWVPEQQVLHNLRHAHTHTPGKRESTNVRNNQRKEGQRTLLKVGRDGHALRKLSMPK